MPPLVCRPSKINSIHRCGAELQAYRTDETTVSAIRQKSVARKIGQGGERVKEKTDTAYSLIFSLVARHGRPVNYNGRQISLMR